MEKTLNTKWGGYFTKHFCVRRLINQPKHASYSLNLYLLEEKGINGVSVKDELLGFTQGYAKQYVI